MSDNISPRFNDLYERRNSGIKLGLAPVRSVLARLGNPHRNMHFIHVAGTNGKGSVCAMIESVLRESGLKTGIYVSPHLVRFNERIRVGGREIGDESALHLVNTIKSLSAECASEEGGRELTFFEFVTVMAFEHFRQTGVEVAVLETGMGGRLDATNVVDPLVSVITGISLEHTAYLGSDIEAIAREKAGIIKQNRPLVLGRMPEPAMVVMLRKCLEMNSQPVIAEDVVSVGFRGFDLDGQRFNMETPSSSYGVCRLPLHGEHQVLNCAVALAAIEVFAGATGGELAAGSLKRGLANTKWRGRFEVLSREPPVIVDGAHNPVAAEALAAAMKKYFPGKRLGMILAACVDKDVQVFLKAFDGMVSNAWTVKSSNERSMQPAELSAFVQELGWTVVESSLEQAMSEASRWALENDGVVCVCGSLFLAGDVLALCGVADSA